MLNRLLRSMYRWYPLPWRRGTVRRLTFRKLGGTILARDERGNRLLLDLGNYVDATLFLEGSFEPEGIAAIEAWITHNEADMFIDVGANIGLYALCIARCPSIRSVHAFEPDPRNYRQLLGNLFLNPDGHKVQTHQVAVSSADGDAEFFVSRAATAIDCGKFNTGTSSLRFDGKRHHMSGTVRVSTRRLDGLIDVHGSILAMKVDVEGHEAEVLSGAERLLRNNTCVVLIEAFDSNFPEVDAVLRELKYARIDSFNVENYHLYTNRL